MGFSHLRYTLRKQLQNQQINIKISNICCSREQKLIYISHKMKIHQVFHMFYFYFILFLFLDFIPQLTANEATGAICKCLVILLHYFTLTNFFWMLVEGLYSRNKTGFEYDELLSSIWFESMHNWEKKEKELAKSRFFKSQEE